MTNCEAQYSCLPLPGLQQHLASSGVPLAYEKWPAGAAAGGPWTEVEQLCATDPALSELRQHLLRHGITFVVFDMDLTVTAKHTRGHLARDPDTMALYLESARATDALKVREKSGRGYRFLSWITKTPKKFCRYERKKAHLRVPPSYRCLCPIISQDSMIVVSIAYRPWCDVQRQKLLL